MPHSCSLATPRPASPGGAEAGGPPREFQRRLGAAEAQGGPGQGGRAGSQAHWSCHHICFRQFCSKGKTGKQTSGWEAGEPGALLGTGQGQKTSNGG